MKGTSLLARTAGHIVLAFAAMCGLLFVPAGTWRYWEGWACIAMLFVPMFAVTGYMLKRQRQLLEKRLLLHEERRTQVLIQAINLLIFVAMLIIAGLDHRADWSHPPPWAVVLANLLMLAGYLLCLRVMLYNPYASRVIELQRDQQLIDSGPYAVVRHPLYAAALVMSLFIPLALGSYRAFLPLLFLPGMLALRILDEEKLLRDGLPGYREYMARVKYRLIPGVW